VYRIRDLITRAFFFVPSQSIPFYIPLPGPFQISRSSSVSSNPLSCISDNKSPSPVCSSILYHLNYEWSGLTPQLRVAP